MKIVRVEIVNFRALSNVSIPLQQFSVLLGENDVGKTSFLYALEKFFSDKKLSDPKDWYQRDNQNDIGNSIWITITFDDLPDNEDLNTLCREDGTLVLQKEFAFDTAPKRNVILEDGSLANISAAIVKANFSKDVFQFIPVRRDLSVQFSMAKTALLGSLLRKTMARAIADADAEQKISEVQEILSNAINAPRESIESFLKQQLNNDSFNLGFNNLTIDPAEGVSFDVVLSDDRVQDVQIQDRGAGTQNNLIIALFRYIAHSNLDGEFIFAMEEPENSLHPKAQRQLLSVIQEISESNQVIVTTHSPVFIDRSRFESNILLTRKAAGNTVAKIFQPQDLSQVRSDLGIRASDALLKGGGNCAILVEGNTEEDGFPQLMELMGLSEFDLGIAIINMGGCDKEKAINIIKLLDSYEIPSVVVLDRDAQTVEEDLSRMIGRGLQHLRQVFRLKLGTIEDYYPLEIIAAVINSELSPTTDVTAEDLQSELWGTARLQHFKGIQFDHGANESTEYLKSNLGGVGTRMFCEQYDEPHQELQEIFRAVETIARET